MDAKGENQWGEEWFKKMMDEPKEHLVALLKKAWQKEAGYDEELIKKQSECQHYWISDYATSSKGHHYCKHCKKEK